jgi:hypothetical protein
MNPKAYPPMPQKSPDAVDKILGYTLVAANTLRDAVTASQISFLSSVCALSLTVIPLVQVWESDSLILCLFEINIVQTTKFHKARCLGILDQIHGLLCVLMSLCSHSEGIRSPKMLDQVAEFAV